MERKEFQLTTKQYETLLDASKSVPYMLGSGGKPLFSSQQENANAAWQALGRELGFLWDSVAPIPGKGVTFFSALAPAEQVSTRRTT